jgi:hypothetical protein
MQSKGGECGMTTRYKVVCIADPNVYFDYGDREAYGAMEEALFALGYEVLEYNDEDPEFNYNDFHELKPGDKGFSEEAFRQP